MRALRASCSLVESGRGDGPPLERCGKSMGSFTVKAISERITDEGMDRSESAGFLRELVARATTADKVYRHEWTVGDFVIWDNRGVIHRVQPYDPSSPREMHRTTIEGDEPIQ